MGRSPVVTWSRPGHTLRAPQTRLCTRASMKVVRITQQDADRYRKQYEHGPGSYMAKWRAQNHNKGTKIKPSGIPLEAWILLAGESTGYRASPKSLRRRLPLPYLLGLHARLAAGLHCATLALCATPPRLPPTSADCL